MIPKVLIKKLEDKKEMRKIKLMIARKLKPIHRQHKTRRMELVILIAEAKILKEQIQNMFLEIRRYWRDLTPIELKLVMWEKFARVTLSQIKLSVK